MFLVLAMSGGIRLYSQFRRVPVFRVVEEPLPPELRKILSPVVAGDKEPKIVKKLIPFRVPEVGEVNKQDVRQIRKLLAWSGLPKQVERIEVNSNDEVVAVVRRGTRRWVLVEISRTVSGWEIVNTAYTTAEAKQPTTWERLQNYIRSRLSKPNK